MSYEFHPVAEEEFLESVGFYESRVSGLGSALIEEFESLADSISNSPRTWKVVAPPNIRLAYFRRFPLSLIYRESADGFQNLAVAHQSRRPRYWIKRI